MGRVFPPYLRNVLGEANPVVQPHALYLELSKDKAERRATSRKLFRGHLDIQVVNDITDIRACLQSGTPLENERIREEIERAW